MISIIIPCYNSSKYILDCLQSVENQNFIEWECIIINDGSTDDSEKKIQTFIKNKSRFILISQENKGLSIARNIGINKAKGNFIFFLDSDDILPINAITDLMDNASEYDIVSGQTQEFLGNSNKLLSLLPYPTIKIGNSPYETLIYTIENGLPPIAPNRLYSTDFLKEFQLTFKEGILHEDELWFFETILKSRKIKFVDKITYFYRVDNYSSITKNYTDKNLESFNLILKEIFSKYFLNNNNTKQKELTIYYLRYLKKVMLDCLLQNIEQFSERGIHSFLSTLKETHITINNTCLLSLETTKYYNAIEKLSVMPINSIKKLFFRNPINSIRKIFLLFYILNLKK